METSKKKCSRKTKIIVIVVAVVILALLAGCLYLLNPYRADGTATAALMPTDTISVEADGKYAIFAPEEAHAGLIFYPGCRVEYTAYAPLMQEFAAQGYFCVIVNMPLNFPLFGVNAAADILEKYPDIPEWYIAGHSLGGTAAARYVSKYPDGISGLLLFGSYTDTDLKEQDLDVLCVYGSEDNIMNRPAYENGKSLVPSNFAELCIEGGNHAGFGNYGAQSGDGEAFISQAKQIETTVMFCTEQLGD